MEQIENCELCSNQQIHHSLASLVTPLLNLCKQLYAHHCVATCMLAVQFHMHSHSALSTMYGWQRVTSKCFQIYRLIPLSYLFGHPLSHRLHRLLFLFVCFWHCFFPPYQHSVLLAKESVTRNTYLSGLITVHYV